MKLLKRNSIVVGSILLLLGLSFLVAAALLPRSVLGIAASQAWVSNYVA